MTTATTWQRLLAYTVIVLGGVATALILGKDFNWDSLSYHLYAGYSVAENRLHLDYFASSAQSYLNPYTHLPFYLMVKSGLDPKLIVAALASFHVLNLLIVYEIAVLLNRRQGGQVAWLAVVLAVFLAFCNAIFFTELGSTFNEITTSVPVLAGWYLLIRDFDTPRRSRLALAGLLIGIGVALKLTNLFYSVTVLPLLLLAPTSWKERAQAVLIVAVAGLLGLLLAGGWWGWQLWEKFGNPLFPMFNQYFHSPDFTASPFKHYRFLHESGLELLLKPFAVIEPLRGVYVETVAPDIRYAALFVLLCLFGLKYAPLGLAREWLRRDPAPQFQANRALLALTASFVLTWAIWAYSSGNGRYFFPMTCIAAVLLASLFFRFSGAWRFLVYGGGALVLVQAGLTLSTSDHRWGATPWTKEWFEIDVPAELQQQPSLYLHLNLQPAAFLMPYLPKESSMINVSGMYVVEKNEKVRALMEKYRGQVRVMRSYGVDFDEAEPKDFNMFLARFDLEADMATCLPIRFNVRSERFPEGVANNYLSCKTKPRAWSAAEREAFRAKRKRSDAVFDRLETVCPAIFQPRGLASEGDGTQFWRYYVNTDTVMQQYESGLVTYRNSYTHSQDVAVGYIGDLEKAMPAKATFCP
jgi:hypothetical protein